MNTNFLTFLNLIKDELSGSLSMDSVLFSDVYKIADLQGMSTLLFPVFKKYFESRRLTADMQDVKKYELSVTGNVFNYTKKQYEVNKVIKALEKEGIECIILKGDTLSSIYPHSDMRMSGDTDILINPKCEKKCLKLFEKMGCYVKKRTKTNNQSVIVHPTAGKFEIHISMDTKQVSEIWYDSVELVKEPYREVFVSGIYKYKTLSYTDTALNLVLHVVKHFVSGIAHMRMITDTVLFMDRNFDKIDFERISATLKHLNYETLFESLKYVGNKYLGLTNLAINEKYSDNALKLLEDIYKCGDYGFDKLEAQSYTYDIYSKNRFEKFGKGTYKNYKIKILLNDTFDLIFKNKYEMMKLYPVLEKKPKLLVFMYVHRFFSCVSHTLFGKKKKSDTNEQSSEDKEFLQKRLELLDKMDMM